jgi:hypothetical protein
MKQRKNKGKVTQMVDVRPACRLDPWRLDRGWLELEARYELLVGRSADAELARP